MQESTKRSRFLSLLRGVGIAASIVAVLIIVIGVWGFAPGSTAKLEDIASQFKAEPGWKLSSETINPKRNACLQADCDELRRVWNLEKEVSTLEEFQSLAKLNNKSMKINNDDCSLNKIENEGFKTCRAAVEIDGYTATLRYSSYSNETPTIVLNIEK